MFRFTSIVLLTATFTCMMAEQAYSQKPVPVFTSADATNNSTSLIDYFAENNEAAAALGAVVDGIFMSIACCVIVITLYLLFLGVAADNQSRQDGFWTIVLASIFIVLTGSYHYCFYYQNFVDSLIASWNAEEVALLAGEPLMEMRHIWRVLFLSFSIPLALLLIGICTFRDRFMPNRIIRNRSAFIAVLISIGITMLTSCIILGPGYIEKPMYSRSFTMFVLIAVTIALLVLSIRISLHWLMNWYDRRTGIPDAEACLLWIALCTLLPASLIG